LVYDTPEKHPRIEEAEKERILNALGDSVDTEHKLPIPWREVESIGFFICLFVTFRY